MYFLFSANTLLFSVSVLFRSDCSHQGWTDIFLLCHYRRSQHVNLCVIWPWCISWFQRLFMFVKQRLCAFCVFIGLDFTRDIHVQFWISHLLLKSAVTSPTCLCPGKLAALLESFHSLPPRTELLFSLAESHRLPRAPTNLHKRWFLPCKQSTPVHNQTSMSNHLISKNFNHQLKF